MQIHQHLIGNDYIQKYKYGDLFPALKGYTHSRVFYYEGYLIVKEGENSCHLFLFF